MASFVRSAPLPELPGVNRTLVEDPGFQELVERSHSLIQKVLLSIPEAHKSCIHIETLQLNSAENAKLVIMAANIGIPSATVLKVVSDNFSLETCLSRMSEGIQLRQALLSAVLPRLDKKDRVNELLADTRDLLVQIHEMQKMVQGESAVQPTPPALNLRLPGEYEVQVATHLTMVQLQSFGQDMVRSLRSLQQSSEEETES